MGLTRVTGMFVPAVASSLNVLCRLSFFVSLDCFRLLVGGRAFALNERLGFTQQRVGDDPGKSATAKVAAFELREPGFSNDSLVERSLSRSLVPESDMSHGQDRINLHLEIRVVVETGSADAALRPFQCCLEATSPILG